MRAADLLQIDERTLRPTAAAEDIQVESNHNPNPNLNPNPISNPNSGGAL